VMTPLMADRALLRRRLLAALEAAMRRLRLTLRELGARSVANVNSHDVSNASIDGPSSGLEIRSAVQKLRT
jgi:hypothetical protein